MPTPDSHLPRTTESDPQRDGIRFAPLAFWLACQLIALCVGAARVSLTARAGDLPQRLALPEMIVVQLAIASMCFPWLLAVGNRLGILVASILFLHLAAMLTSTAPLAEFWTTCAIVIWLIALSENRRQTQSSIRVSIVTAIFCGVPVLQYLCDDFGDANSSISFLAWINPIGSIIRQSTDARITSHAFALPLSCAVVKIFFTLTRRTGQRT